jgi:hypothetical protein
VRLAIRAVIINVFIIVDDDDNDDNDDNDNDDNDDNDNDDNDDDKDDDASARNNFRRFAINI